MADTPVPPAMLADLLAANSRWASVDVVGELPEEWHSLASAAAADIEADAAVGARLGLADPFDDLPPAPDGWDDDVDSPAAAALATALHRYEVDGRFASDDALIDEFAEPTTDDDLSDVFTRYANERFAADQHVGGTAPTLEVPRDDGDDHPAAAAGASDRSDVDDPTFPADLPDELLGTVEPADDLDDGLGDGLDDGLDDGSSDELDGDDLNGDDL